MWWECWESRAVGLPSMPLLETFMQGFLNIPPCKRVTKVSKSPCSKKLDVVIVVIEYKVM